MMSEESKESSLTEAIERFRESEELTAQWRANAKNDLRFANGDQWPEAVRAMREQDNLPVLTIDRLEGAVSQLIGDQRQNAIEIRITNKRDNKMQDTAGQEVPESDMVMGHVREIMRQSRFSMIQSAAYQDAVNCGMGGWYLDTDYKSIDTFDQEIRINRIINPMSLFPDIRGLAQGRMDWCHVVEPMKRDKFKRAHPGAASDFPADLNGWASEDEVLVSMYWYTEYKSDKLLMVRNGEQYLNVLASVFKEGGEGEVLRERPVKVPTIKRQIMTSIEVLDEDIWPGQTIPVAILLGQESWVDGNFDAKGIIRKAKDSQILYNYYRSSVAEVMGATPKAPYLLTPEQVAGFEKMWAEANKGKMAYLLYNPDPRAPQPQRNQIAFPQGFAQEAAICADDIKATTKIFDAGLGSRSNETSGRAIIARQKEGDTGNYTFSDNLKYAVELTGKIIVEALPKVYDGTRTITTSKPDGSSQQFQLNAMKAGERTNSLSGGYDVEVTSGPAYNTMREQTVDAMMSLAQAVPTVGAVGADIWVRNQDWPGADELADRLKKTIPPNLLDESDPTRKVAELQTQLMQMQQMIQQMGMPTPVMQPQPQGMPPGMPPQMPQQ